uniref:Cytochrome b n=1 Tax=Rozella allomycis TaxID=281847 RepID=R9R6T3_9FUNG|nr:apocytochrome b [Rozella allomycis]AGK83074.1 apocytochrome b [Rozella allomycis]
MYRLFKKDSLFIIFNKYLYDSLINYNITYIFNIGSLLGFSILIQIVTGILLSLYYNSILINSYDSIYYIMLEIRNGSLIRFIHIIGVSLIFILLYLHIYKSLYYNSYIYPKSNTYYIGIFIFIIIIIISFLGYSLVGGQQSYWGIVVICNILSIIPYIKEWFTYYIWGNYYISNDTINRLFSFHYLLGLIILIFIIIHLIYLHTNGGNSILGLNNNSSMINFNIYYTIKDLYSLFIYIFILLYISFYIPYNYIDKDNNNIYNSIITPISIVPHWYLLYFYCILRCFYNKHIGVIIMFSSILILFILPFTNISFIKSNKFKLFNIYFLNSIIYIYSILIYIGSCHINKYYIILSKILILYYFLYFTILLFLLNLLNNILYYYSN